VIRDPQTLGLYRVEAMLGRGGMGAVYRCRHERLGVIRAVKLLTGRMTPQRVERFSREAQALARLNHPSVVAIHDVGQTPTGELYYAMDLIEGKPLDEAVELPLGFEEALALSVAIARAVDVLHDAGLVHRDLKPGNVMIRPDGTPVVLDLGLAFALDSDSRLTKTGAFLGTPLYMAPEQGGGSKRPTPAADVFSLGLIALELLSGVAISELDALPAFAPPPAASQLNPALPLALDAVIAKATHQRVEERYGRAGEFADALEGLASGGFSRRARWLVWSVLALLGVTGGGALAAHLLTQPVDRAPHPAPNASAEPSPSEADLPDLSQQAARVLRELGRLPRARDRQARALGWLAEHPRGKGREQVLAAAEEASLQFEQVWLPGSPRTPGHMTAAFASSNEVIGIWNHVNLARWTLDTSDPFRPTASAPKIELLKPNRSKGQLISDPSRGAVVRHAPDGIEWFSPTPGDTSLPPRIPLPPVHKTEDLALGPRGEQVVAARGQSVWWASLAQSQPVELAAPGRGLPRRVAFTPDGRRLLVAWAGLKDQHDLNYWIELIDLETRERLEQWPLASQPNGLRHLVQGAFAIGCSDGQIVVVSPGAEPTAPFSRAGLGGEHRNLAHAFRVVALATVRSPDLVVTGAQARDERRASDFAVWRRDARLVREGQIEGILVQLSTSPDGNWLLTSTSSGFGLIRLRGSGG
jgi:serine/threonine protein kinase